MESQEFGLILMGIGMMILGLSFLNHLTRKVGAQITPLQAVWIHRKNVPDMISDPELSDLVHECLLFIHNELFKFRLSIRGELKRNSVSTNPHEMLEIEAELIEGDYFPTHKELYHYMMLFLEYQGEQFDKGRITQDQLKKYVTLNEYLTKLGLDLLNPKQQ